MTTHVLRLALHTIGWLAVGATCLAGSAAEMEPGARQANRPNIVVLYADDAGYADFGFQPNCREDMKRLTPHIDRIAREGARFTDAYMSGCVCSPSRAGLMTGIYQERFGHDNNLPPGMQDGLPLQITFGAKRLQALGYRTALVGKWHLGYPPAFHPNRRGFDWFYGLLQGSRPYFPMRSPSAYRVIQENGKPTPEKGYVTDRFGDAACRFIRAHRDEPFFLFVSFTAPHGPLQAKQEVLKRLASIPNQKRRRYAGLVVSLDENVGKVLDCLDELGLAKKTLVVFTNDNGGQTRTGANNWPLRGRKGTMWEGGIRVPWAMRWPGVIEPGTVIRDPVIALDLVPTFIEAAGGKIDPAWRCDGVSLVKRLRGHETRLPERPLFWRRHGSGGDRAMRLGKWKLVHNRRSGQPPALFDLARDIGETTDLASVHPKRLKELLAQLDAWEAELAEPRWGPGAPGRRLGGGARRRNEKPAPSRPDGRAPTQELTP